MRAIKIDTQNQKIIEYENTGLESLQAAVGGCITIAFDLPDGSTCFVNDEGLFDQSLDFFTLKAYPDTPFAGNGVIVGAVDEEGETTPCTLDINDLKDKIRFLTRLEVVLKYRE